MPKTLSVQLFASTLNYVKCKDPWNSPLLPFSQHGHLQHPQLSGISLLVNEAETFRIKFGRSDETNSDETKLESGCRY